MATFGETGTGTTESQAGGDLVRGSKFTLSERGQISSITAYIRVANAGTVNVKFGIYTDVAGTPTTLKGTTSAVSFTNTSKSWVTASFTAPLDLLAGTYWIMFNNDAGTGTGGLWYGSDTLLSGETLDNETYPAFATTYTVDATVNNRVSIYSTYTPGAPVTGGFIAVFNL